MASAWKSAEEGNLLDEDIDLLLESQEAGGNARDSILFLIDCSPSMFVPLQDGQDAPWVAAMKCASATMKNKIISSEDDLVGVLFYNTVLTERDRNMANFKGIYLLQKPDVPDAERIRELEKLAKNSDHFKATVGSATVPTIMGNVFWSCSSLFGPLKNKVGSKRVFLFTNEDNPHEGNIPMQKAAKIRARDLSDLGIFIELFNLNRPDHRFDLSAFYQDILPTPVGEDEEAELASASADSSEKFEELMAKVRRKESRKRAVSRLPMILGEGMAVSVRAYTLYMEAKKGPYVWMDSATRKLAAPITEWIDQSTGASLARQELKFFYDFGGVKAIFTKEELAAVKDLGSPGLTILGFRPTTWLKPHYNMTHSTFIFPDEAAMRGSIVAFSALLKGMLEMNQLAIAAYISRRAVPLRLVALVPQAEKIDPDTGVQIKPPGLTLITLPFADDLRKVHAGQQVTPADPELVDKAKEIIAKLTISGGFDPEAFENPAIQRHYASLQALALDEELDEEDLKDRMQPDVARMQKRAGTQIVEFISMIPANEIPVAAAGTKRRAKATSVADEPVRVDIDAIAGDQSKLGRLTVAELKAYAESKGIKPARLKADLIQQIMQHCSEKA